ncbi:excalibur calcium-binding domain-containing protein [Pseudonocardia sediminis]|uniref:Excalibur calcium-binding domain-containing protein n=1 Tax=Pseudonocardia sediminis TaxID=1397368 RepID=A0A4Q7V439_PSEST|nr:excalibur calcium-binding domain-containing protein [Pseudonocardia sediminis]RZT88241.1 excalibur calcium-binding domain-containing protein [Pseudonocardia sediminis]
MSGRHRRRRRRWVPAACAAAIAVLLAAAVYSVVTLSSTSTVAAPGDAGEPGVFDRTATVSGVVDGDSFTIDGGGVVRVLAADSCEMRTDAGPAGRADAERVLLGATVSLRREPAAVNDADRDGRLLRYVEVPGLGDLGSFMVQRPHTGAYRGVNDASPEYLDGLRALDRDGRRCIANLPGPEEKPQVDYPDCAAAAAAGQGAIYVGDPGYSRRLDGDDDGVACE